MDPMPRTVLVVSTRAPPRSAAPRQCCSNFAAAGGRRRAGHHIGLEGGARADCVLLDVNFSPRWRRGHLAGRLTATARRPPSVLVSTLEASALGDDVERCGARGLPAEPQRLAAAVRTPRAAVSKSSSERIRRCCARGSCACSATPGFEVVAQAGDAPDLLRKVAAHKPDVAIVDVQMPPDNTTTGSRGAEIRASQPESACSCSPVAEERYAVDLIGDNAEGVGYLLKDRVTDFTGFAEAVRRVAPAAPCSTPPSSRTCSAGAVATNRSRSDAARARGDGADGAGPLNKGIAEELVVTPHAVEKHVTAIFAKLGVRRGAGPPPRAAVLDVPGRSIAE